MEIELSILEWVLFECPSHKVEHVQWDSSSRWKKWWCLKRSWRHKQVTWSIFHMPMIPSPAMLLSLSQPTYMASWGESYNYPRGEEKVEPGSHFFCMVFRHQLKVELTSLIMFSISLEHLFYMREIPSWRQDYSINSMATSCKFEVKLTSFWNKDIGHPARTTWRFGWQHREYIIGVVWKQLYIPIFSLSQLQKWGP